jgi:hypothetical protein
MKHCRIILAILALTLFSCGDRDDNVTQIKFSEEIMLSADSISVQQLLNPSAMTITNEFLVIHSRNTDSIFYFYRLPDLRFEKRIGSYGQGPDEFTRLARFCESTTKDLFLRGYNNYFVIKRFSVDSEANLHLKETYNLAQSALRNPLNSPSIVRDSLLLFNEFPAQSRLVKYNLQTNQVSGIISISDKPNETLVSEARGSLIANDSTLAYAYLLMDKIDLYDVTTMKLRTTLIGGKYKDITGEGNITAASVYYGRVYGGSRYFYAMYAHGESSGNKEAKISLDIFDYAGTPKVRVFFSVTPEIFTVDEMNGYLYAYNPNHEDSIFVYKLPAYLYE